MGEVDDSLQSKRIVFVTVGTTSFDSLVRAVDTREVRKALFEKGYTHLLIQMGRGSYIPMKDNYAVQSFERGIAAQDGGAFTWEIVLVEVSGGTGKPSTIVDKDEGLGKLVKLPRFPCVNDVFTKYLEYRSKKDSIDSWWNIVKSVLARADC